MNAKETTQGREPAGSAAKQGTGAVFVFLSAVLFSIGGLCVKIVPWSPLAINGARNLIAAAIIGVYLKAVRHRIVVNPAVLFGAICLAGTTTLYCMANKLTTAANAIVLQFTAPVFVIFLSWAFFREKPGRRDLAPVSASWEGSFAFLSTALQAAIRWAISWRFCRAYAMRACL